MHKQQHHSAPALRRIVDVLWFFVCLVTLGFSAKYRERLRLFETLFPPPHINPDTYSPWSLAPTFADCGSDDKDKPQKTMREKQQEEWDRLNITVSVITATSAAALAIQATSDQTKVYWVVTAFYSIAFGLSLEGLILITYMTITAGGSSDEAIWRLAKGNLLSRNLTAVKPVAFIMALPAVLATYSSISLLVGLVAMVVAGSWDGVDNRKWQYTLVTMIPVGIGFVFLCMAIILCELGAWIEIWGRREYLNEREYISATADLAPQVHAQELAKIRAQVSAPAPTQAQAQAPVQV